MTAKAEQFAAKLFESLAEYRQSVGTISRRMWEEAVAEFYDKWAEKTTKRRAKPARVGSGPGTNIPPTVEEVRARCLEMGYTFNPERFMAYYLANGWKVGKNPMKNWHGACVTFQGDAPKREAKANMKAGSAEPTGWRSFVRENFVGGEALAQKAWAEHDTFTQRHIRSQMAENDPTESFL